LRSVKRDEAGELLTEIMGREDGHAIRIRLEAALAARGMEQFIHAPVE